MKVSANVLLILGTVSADANLYNKISKEMSSLYIGINIFCLFKDRA
jgi:hypothetical protein